MGSILFAVLAAGTLFAAALLAIEVGYRLGRKRRREDPDAVTRGIGGMEAAVFGLLGLLIAFVFSGAASRFEARRQLIVAEANAIGTAALRVDLLPAPDQPAVRELLRQYVDARIGYHAAVRDGGDDATPLAGVGDRQRQVWAAANDALRRQGSAPATQLLLPALNEAFDTGSARVAATRMHTPATIVVLLFAIVLFGSMLAGFGMSARLERARLHTLVFAVAMTATVYVTLDLDLPRAGLIRLDSMDHLLVDARRAI